MFKNKETKLIIGANMILLVVDAQKLIMTEELYNFEVVKDNIT